jgi:dTDP-3-amino-2,3,6-trideoxy-4-keto-D-glucose/dTDP-3-amino-3,4,6-trideoxy-alpha-D-glucose/dTDP-2,6-dideoxy-D-kanosamine transaminase
VIPINDLSRNLDLDSHFFTGLKDLVNSGQFINGEHTKSLEETLKNLIGVDFAIGVSSGTAALDLALTALDLPEGSGVLLAANAGGYARIAIEQNRLIPIYVDVDSNGLIGAEELEILKLKGLAPARAIVVTYLYGQCKNLVAVKKFGEENDLILIEDCAQSIGAKFSGINAGSVGDISTFSFYPTKNLGAIGDAGAVLTSNANLARRIKSLKQYGWDAKYDVIIKNGANQRIDEVQAFALNWRISKLENLTMIRKSIWGKFSNSAAKSGLRMIGELDDSFVAHLGIIDCLGRREVIKDFLNNSGISTDVHYPIPDHRQFAWLDDNIHLPETERQAKDFLTIPLFVELTPTEISQICEALEGLTKIL